MKELLLALDIGNVCIKIDHKNFLTSLGIQEFPEGFWNTFRDFEQGRITEENDFFNRLTKLTENRFSQKKLRQAFNTILISPMPGMIEAVRKLSASNVKVVFFSDISPTHWQQTCKIFPPALEVYGGVFSFKSGAYKPDEAMFSYFEKNYGIPSLYVDDRIELIEAAGNRAWNSSVFAGAEDLLEKLAALS